jgi:hypothetical protein
VANEQDKNPITYFAKSALKKMYKMGDSGDPCGRPGKVMSIASVSVPFTTTVARLFEQKEFTHWTTFVGMPLLVSLSVITYHFSSVDLWWTMPW